MCRKDGYFLTAVLGDLIFPPLNKRRAVYIEIETSSSCPRCIYFCLAPAGNEEEIFTIFSRNNIVHHIVQDHTGLGIVSGHKTQTFAVLFAVSFFFFFRR